MSYKPQGDTRVLSELEKAHEEFKNLQNQGKKAKNTKTIITNQINTIKINIDEHQKEILRLNQLIEVENNKINSNNETKAIHTDELEDNQKQLQLINERFQEQRRKRDKARESYYSSIPKGSLSQTRIGLFKSEMNPEKVTTIYGLGDVHGWAPGLITFLIGQNIAKIKINGLAITSAKDLQAILPNPSTYEGGLQLEGPWFHNNNISPPQTWDHSPGAIRSVEVEPLPTFLQEGLVVQVGDLADRGDYTELTFEVMRQLIVSSKGKAFMLLGNHEEFLVSGNFASWLKNEEKLGVYSPVKNKEGSIRLDPKIAGHKRAKTTEETGTQITEFHQSLFHSYSAHLAQLLLGQEFTIRSLLDTESAKRWAALTQPSLDVAGINNEQLEHLATTKNIEDLPKCLEWLEAVRRKASEEAGLVLAGAPVVCSIGHVMALHAESNALEKLTDEEKASINQPYRTKQGAQISLLPYTFGLLGPGKPKSPHAHLMWQRDSNVNFYKKVASTDLKRAMESVKKAFPHISSIIHGHTPITTKGDYTTHEISIDTSKGKLNIINLDYGMSPWYSSRDMNLSGVGKIIKTINKRPSIFDPALTPVESSIRSHLTSRPWIEQCQEGMIRGKYRKDSFQIDFKYNLRPSRPSEITFKSQGHKFGFISPQQGLITIRSEITVPANESILLVHQERKGFFQTVQMTPILQIGKTAKKNQDLRIEQLREENRKAIILGEKKAKEKIQKEEYERHRKQQILEKEDAAKREKAEARTSKTDGRNAIKTDNQKPLIDAQTALPRRDIVEPKGVNPTSQSKVLDPHEERKLLEDLQEPNISFVQAARKNTLVAEPQTMEIKDEIEHNYPKTTASGLTAPLGNESSKNEQKPSEEQSFVRRARKDSKNSEAIPNKKAPISDVDSELNNIEKSTSPDQEDKYNTENLKNITANLEKDSLISPTKKTKSGGGRNG
ncbi:metallophosphoesterase [Euryarchaeota archaeon]|nr:metallophosphoesterase [Euryarchaeota archaeon]